VIQPPRVGPITGAAIIPIPKVVIASVCSSTGNVSSRIACRLKPKVVLFVCTGNYYRSRFAELLFNSSARRERLGWQAISRGLELAAQNVGPISPHVCSGLRAREVELEYAGLRSPLPLAQSDLVSADHDAAYESDEGEQH
jgi:Low molecular weight phosphotyrosine protein phosphatase